MTKSVFFCNIFLSFSEIFDDYCRREPDVATLLCVLGQARADARQQHSLLQMRAQRVGRRGAQQGFLFFLFLSLSFSFSPLFYFSYSYVLLTGYGCRNKYAATRTRSARERSTSRCVATFNTDSASEWVHLSSSRFDRNSLSSYSYICASHLVTRRSGTSAEEAKGRQASEKVAARNGW